MPLPLRTPEEMYDYCVKNDCGWGMTRIWATKHFELIVNSLNPDEKVCAVFIGLYNFKDIGHHDFHFAFAVTNQRFVMAQKRLLGEKMKTVSLDHINDIVMVRSGIAGIGLGIVQINTIRGRFNVAVNVKVAKNIYGVLLQALDEAKANPRKTAFNMITAPDSVAPKSPVEQVKELKELLDIGAITQEEFDRKKKELLGL